LPQYLDRIRSDAFFAANVTLMLLTLHALTEVTTVFLLCLGLTIATGGVTGRQKLTPLFRYSLLLLVAAMLTVVKPVFLYVAIPLILFQVFYLIEKSQGVLRRYGILLLLAAVSPILIQVGIVKVKHQRWGISDIGQQTLNRYMFAVLYSHVEQQPFEQARSEVATFSLTEMGTYARRHFPVAVQVWGTLVRINLTDGSASAVVPGPHPLLAPYMFALNRLYYCIHLAMIAPVVLVAVFMLTRRKWARLGCLMLLAGPVIVVFATSGLTFWQGDRIVVPVLPVWITLYACVLQCLFREVRRGLQVLLPARLPEDAGH
jgi:hypothetical protein